jgi:hypothetical protein
MNAGMPIRQKVRLVAIGATLTAASFLLVSLYGHAIYQLESPGPVEQWIKKGCELHRLSDAADGGFFTNEEYKSERLRLTQEEDRIVYHNDFPRDKAGLARYQKARNTSPSWAFASWAACAVSVMTAIAAAAWLEGAKFAECDANRVAEDLS